MSYLNSIKYNTYLHTDKKWVQFLYTTIGAIIFAISSNISIPTQIIPFTLQSMVVLLIGALLGKKLGSIAIIEAFCLGLLGLPIFANYHNSYMALASPSFGFIIGFVFCAYIAGWAAEKGFDRKIISAIILFGIAHQVIFLFGVLYLAIYLGSLKEAFFLGYYPFIGWDALKFTSAAIIIFGLWKIK